MTVDEKKANAKKRFVYNKASDNKASDNKASDNKASDNKELPPLKKERTPRPKKTEAEKNATAVERGVNSARKVLAQRDALSQDSHDIAIDYPGSSEGVELLWNPTRDRLKKGIMDLVLKTPDMKQAFQLSITDDLSKFLRHTLPQWSNASEITRNVNLPADFISRETNLPTAAGRSFIDAFKSGDFRNTPIPVWANLGKGKIQNDKYLVDYDLRGQRDANNMYVMNSMYHTDPERFKKEYAQLRAAAREQGLDYNTFMDNFAAERLQEQRRLEEEEKDRLAAEKAGLSIEDYLAQKAEKTETNKFIEDLKADSARRVDDLIAKTKRAMSIAVVNNDSKVLDGLEKRLQLLENVQKKNKFVTVADDGTIIIKSNRNEGIADAYKAKGDAVPKFLTAQQKRKSFFEKYLKDDDVRRQWMQREADAKESRRQKAIQDTTAQWNTEANTAENRNRIKQRMGTLMDKGIASEEDKKAYDDIQYQQNLNSSIKNKIQTIWYQLSKEFDLPKAVVKQIVTRDNVMDAAVVGPDGNANIDYDKVKSMFANEINNAQSQSNILNALM